VCRFWPSYGCTFIIFVKCSTLPPWLLYFVYCIQSLAVGMRIQTACRSDGLSVLWRGCVENIASCPDAVIPRVGRRLQWIDSHLVVVRRVACSHAALPTSPYVSGCLATYADNQSQNIEISQAIITRQAATSLHAPWNAKAVRPPMST